MFVLRVKVTLYLYVYDAHEGYKCTCMYSGDAAKGRFTRIQRNLQLDNLNIMKFDSNYISQLLYMRMANIYCLHTFMVVASIMFRILDCYAPGLKCLPGASSNRIIRPSICLSTCNSVPLYSCLKFGWWYSNQTGLQVHLKVAYTSLTSHAPGVGLDKNIGLIKILPYFDFVAAGGNRVSQTHV